MIPMSAYSTLLAGVQSGDLPRGKSLKELMSISLQQFEQDKKAFAQEKRAGGGAGEVSYSYQDPFFEETNLEEEETAADQPGFAPRLPGMRGIMAQFNAAGLGAPPTDNAPSEFETWMATKYGGASA
jgi:hypothetical protein